MTENQIAKSRQRLERFLLDLLEPIGRSERRHWGELYVRGLLQDGSRKSIGPMAARLPDGNVRAMQQFVGQSPWQWQEVWARLGKRMTAELELLDQARGWGLPDRIVLGDAGYGEATEFRDGLEERGLRSGEEVGLRGAKAEFGEGRGVAGQRLEEGPLARGNQRLVGVTLPGDAGALLPDPGNYAPQKKLLGGPGQGTGVKSNTCSSRGQATVLTAGHQWAIRVVRNT